MRTSVIALTACMLSLSVFMVSSDVAHAASVSLLPPGQSISKSESFPIGLRIQTGDDAISGTDVYITYDNKALVYQGVNDLHYFPFVHAVQDTDNTVHVSAVVSDAKGLKKGEGQFASVMFKALKSGKTVVSISCAAGEKGSSKIIRGDLDATDVIDCTNVEQLTLSVTDTSLLQKAYTFLFGWLK